MSVAASERAMAAAFAEEPLIQGHPSLGDVTRDIARPLERRAGAGWYLLFAVAASALLLGVGLVAYTIMTGIGVWGLNRTVGWGTDITNFVFWVGIGHAGTLISAILLLLRQHWRTSIARSAEAMTIFAVICAGMFPIIHMGRPWLGYFALPYPNSRGPLWVNFRSALAWDVFAISTYFTVSLLFWYVGLIPDFATMRDRAKGLRKRLYGWLSLGWDGSSRTWARYEKACLILAGLATPLVVSVHTIVSMDFATSVIPGWHATIFPPYFVVGAVFSGFAMVITLAMMTRAALGLQKYITARHLDNMAKVILTTGMIVGLAYLTETFIAFYSGNPYEQFTFKNRAFGPYAIPYWIMVSCNVITPQLFWFKKIRTNVWATFIMAFFVNIGMWFERFVITVTSLHRDYLPSSWNYFRPTMIDVGTFIGSFGLFFTLFLLFLRYIPMIAIAEVKGVLPQADPHHGAHEHEHEHAHEGAAEGHPVPAE